LRAAAAMIPDDGYGDQRVHSDVDCDVDDTPPHSAWSEMQRRALLTSRRRRPWRRKRTGRVCRRLHR